MNMKENLKLAIESLDWSGVCEVYQSMFGESIDAPNIHKNNPNPQLLERISDGLSDLQKIVGLDYTEQEHKTPVVLEEDDEEDQTEVMSTSSANWEKDVKVEFVSSSGFELPEDQTEGYSKALEIHKKRKREVRDPYQSQMIKCSKCDVEFDYNKEYPAGMLDSSRGIRCNRCRMAT